MTTTLAAPQIKTLVKSLQVLKKAKEAETAKTAECGRYYPEHKKTCGYRDDPTTHTPRSIETHTLTLFVGSAAYYWDKETQEYMSVDTGLDLQEQTPQGLVSYVALTHFTVLGFIDSLEQARKAGETVEITADDTAMILHRQAAGYDMTVRFNRYHPENSQA